MSEVLVKSVARKSMMFSNVTVDITFPRIKINMDRVEGQNIKHNSDISQCKTTRDSECSARFICEIPNLDPLKAALQNT